VTNGKELRQQLLWDRYPLSGPEFTKEISKSFILNLTLAAKRLEALIR